MSVYIPHACPVTTEARTACQIHWKWCAEGCELPCGCQERNVGLRDDWAISPAPTFSFYFWNFRTDLLAVNMDSSSALFVCLLDVSLSDWGKIQFWIALICISLVAKDIENLLKCLLGICVCQLNVLMRGRGAGLCLWLREAPLESINFRHQPRCLCKTLTKIFKV